MATESIYALSYGISKKDLRKGIVNALKFNCEAIKFIPWTLPKYLVVKPTKTVIQKFYSNNKQIV